MLLKCSSEDSRSGRQTRIKSRRWGVKILLYAWWSHGGGPLLRFDPCAKSPMSSKTLYSFNFSVFLHRSILETYSGVLHRVEDERNILTYSMVQSPSWEANWFAASQEIPRILRNPKVHYRTHKPPPPVPILGQPYPVHIPTSHLLEIHPNIIHTSTPRSPQWSLSLRFPHQNPIRPLFSPYLR